MKKLLKTSFYTGVGVFLLGLNSANAASDPSTMFGDSKVTVGGEDAALETAVQGYIDTAATYLSILAVLLALYGGFNILTAAGDEEKVKKGKTIIIQAAIGLLVIFLASSIIGWFLTLLT